jgi:hypothetical protein
MAALGENSNNLTDNLKHNKTEKISQMFNRIIGKTDVNIQSQQITETDLTSEQKVQILEELFEQSPSVFLTRFGKWISVADLCCFSAASGSEIEYAINVLKKSLSAKSSGICVKNRRYEALQRLEKDTSYFSDEEMQQRCPLLYEQYIGQYMTDEERFEKDEAKMKDEVKMSSFIFQQIDRDWLKKKEMEEREMEECMEEEEDSDNDNEGYDEDNRDNDETIEGYNEDAKGHGNDILKIIIVSLKIAIFTPSNSQLITSLDLCLDVADISAEDKEKLRDEFLNLMRQRFLEGVDEDFDYTKVDASDEYDNLDILGQDEEDKYFDEEEPEMINLVINDKSVGCNEEQMMSDSEEDDYLSDKMLEKCHASNR